MPAKAMRQGNTQTTGLWRVGWKRALLWAGVWLVVAGLVGADVWFHGRLVRQDEPVAKWMYDHATTQAGQICSWVTHIGSASATIGVGMVVGLRLIWKRRWGWLIWWVLALSGSALFTNLLKRLFARPRPVIYTHFPPAPGFSFPSGHTLGSTVMLGMLAYMLMRLVHREHDRRVIAGIAVLLTLGVGFSLLYIGVHFLTDVMAGLALGWTWVGLCILGLEREGD